jgi:alkylation response protein AidB-like acyl-CoA dehydrogenase
MDFDLSPEQQAIFDVARSFAIDRLAPNAVEWDQTKTFPAEVIREMAGFGVAGIAVSEEFGGSALGYLDATLIFEALSYGCPTIASFVSIHTMCAGMINRHGQPELRARLLPKLVTAEIFASYCLTEPGSGSDAAALQTRADVDGDDFVLSGTKSFISGAGISGVYVVMARTGGAGSGGISAIAVESGTPGLSFGKNERKMGWNAQPTAEVRFDQCRVGRANLLGEIGRGFAYAMAALDGGRLNIAASALGAAQSALDKTLAYMRDRRTFEKPLDQHQALRFRLADMETRMQAARGLLRQAAWMLDRSRPEATKFCAMAKRFVTDTAFDVANDALQLHGGYGYLAEFGLEKIVRDLRVHQILEGTNEIMRLVIARELISDGAR